MRTVFEEEEEEEEISHPDPEEGEDQSLTKD